MDYLIDESQEGITIQLDLKRCFYNVDINYLKEKVVSFISNDKKLKNDKTNELNDKIFKCIMDYNEQIKQHSYLPIGFLPSNILINTYLENLDEYIINELNPLSYGRYVDDITIVLKRKIGKNMTECSLQRR